jgi:hypothetical protein
MMRIVVACLVVMLGIHYALAQNAARHWITTSSSNSTVAFAAKAILDSVIVSNPNAASPGYLKLYNKATFPVCGTDTPVWTVPLYASGVPPLTGLNLNFSAGIAFCVTGAIADNDSSNGPANAVIDLGLSGSVQRPNPTTP